MPCASASETKMFELKCSTGRLGFLEVEQCILFKEGSSILGDGNALGEVDILDPWSETSDGAASRESALEPSDVDGEGSGISILRWFEGKFEESVRGWTEAAGRA